MSKTSLETLVSLAKRRGFVFQASEIYGGLSGFYDYGPYGAQLIRNIQKLWWHHFVQSRPNMFGLDTAIIQHPKLWQASGHLDTFSDPMVECSNCKARLREDHLKDKKKCPVCGKTGTLGKPRAFKLMFKTSIGAVEDASNTAYLRPETAGGIFAEFENVREVMRAKLPFGIAQIGKAFRNEISPRDFLFRVREFQQMEIEYFVRPENAKKEFDNLKQICWDWFLSIGVDKTKLKWYNVPKADRAHYSAGTYDLMYTYPHGADELFGIANRTDFDLKAHAQASGKQLDYYDQEADKRIVPFVIEPSFGVDRLFMALLDSAYHEEEVKGEKRVVLKLDPQLAPVQVAVLPLSKDKKLSPLASKVYDQLKDKFVTEYDETQSIGKRYRRQDEIGTPYCVTVDFDSLEDKKVTVRYRDTMKQKRVEIDTLSNELV
jgi:glycyl-tRNA synthetase